MLFFRRLMNEWYRTHDISRHMTWEVKKKDRPMKDVELKNHGRVQSKRKGRYVLYKLAKGVKP
jgi:hypothetical protein